jgi:hypothetical protein
VPQVYRQLVIESVEQYSCFHRALVYHLESPKEMLRILTGEKNWSARTRYDIAKNRISWPCFILIYGP